MTTVSAVISTFERPDGCERALVSALSQEPSPMEVLVCDDGSADGTPERFRAWERREDRVRYLRLEPNRGTPGPARNAGLKHAGGEWVAFLDDDDEWLPEKLAKQLALVEGADVIATNAKRTGGGLYFPDAPKETRPDRRGLHEANPVLLSSALVRRERLLAAGGFPEARWMRGVEDYAAWLALADLDARFVVLGDPCVAYADHGEDRFSGAPLRVEAALARLAWQRLRANPRDSVLQRAALNRTHGALVVTLRRLGRGPRPR
jgi:glycosyltransferase involved in cell wall biosynthesis